MSAAHIALLVIGITAMIESSWGFSSPGAVKEVVKKLLEDAPPISIGMGVFFSGLVVGLWVLIGPDGRLADIALMLLSWVFAGGALANFMPGGLHKVLHRLILDRTDAQIRCFYATELLVGCVLIGIALTGS